MSDFAVPDNLYLLISRPTCYGTSSTAQQFRVFDSWAGAEVLGYYTTEDEAAEELERLVESHNYELYGPPKSALAIAQVNLA